MLKRDSSSIKAYTRAGSAHLGLGQPEAAAAMFKQALQLDATYSAAQVGVLLQAYMSRKVVGLVGSTMRHHQEAVCNAAAQNLHFDPLVVMQMIDISSQHSP